MKDRRTQIVEAATAVMRRQGFSDTSIDQVIREAGLCGKGHFYHYFKSKEELGYAVLKLQFESFAERGLAALREPTVEPIERLTRFIDAVISAH
jgi:TetR/AcrR family transcriptional repressor of nem operon